MLLTGRVEELKRKLASIGKILFGELLKLGKTAHRHVLVERKDEVAEEHVSPGIHECLRHSEAIQRTDHQYVLPAQIDPEIAAHKAYGLALQRVLQAAAIDDRRDRRGFEQSQTVA